MVRKIKYILEKYTINLVQKVCGKILEKISQINNRIRLKTDIESPIILFVSFVLATAFWSWVRQNSV
tara:strand:+ start:324 stop:524 length:201 start_codon:yes stop_codon:yes gene_type:complete